jgi:membrane protein YqaA with SNARE-associated domain
MLKRAWFVIAIMWSGLGMLNGFTRANGPTRIHVGLAIAPLIVARIARFIVLGLRPRGATDRFTK